MSGGKNDDGPDERDEHEDDPDHSHHPVVDYFTQVAHGDAYDKDETAGNGKEQGILIFAVMKEFQHEGRHHRLQSQLSKTFDEKQSEQDDKSFGGKLIKVMRKGNFCICA